MARPTFSKRALVVRHTKLKEIDTILTLLTVDGARHAAIARGLRKPGSRFGGRVEQFCVIDGYFTQGAQLDTLNDVRLIDPNLNLRATSLELTYAALTICDLASKISYENLSEPYLFQMTTAALSTLNTLNQASNQRVRAGLIATAYLLKATALMGWYPVLDACAICGTPLNTPSDNNIDLWWFSSQEGGCICPNCFATSGELTQVNAATLSWLNFMLNARFSQLTQDNLPPALICELLELASDWVSAQVETHLFAVNELIRMINLPT